MIPRSLARRRLVATALVAVLGVVSTGCTDPSPPSPSSATESAGPTSSEDSSPASPSTTSAADAEGWARLDRELTALGPEVGFLAARVSPDGTCQPIHEVRPTTPRPIASQFKLFVLGALAEQIADGRTSWDATLTVDAADQSLGNGGGSLQVVPAGTEVSIEEAATKMISISDNTATDVLIDHLGRDAVEAHAARWISDASANVPFLTTKQMFKLHYVPDLAERYLSTPREERAAFLAAEVDTRPFDEIFAGLSAEPRFVDAIEWFASPQDICVAFAGLSDLAKDGSLAPLSTVLSQQVAGIGLDPEAWPTVWYKGGSEPGVLTLGWLATNADGETFVVEAMVSDPEAPLSETSITDLRDLADDAFELIEQRLRPGG